MCGVFGVWAPGEDVAKLTYFGLYALQHRGQESAGIAVSNGRQILVYKDMGLVSQVFDESTLESLKGHVAIGHSRYSTTGASTWHNAQPTFHPTVDGSIALAHNGNLINTGDLAKMVDDLGEFEGQLELHVKLPSVSTNDTSVVTSLLAHHAGLEADLCAAWARRVPSADDPNAVALTVMALVETLTHRFTLYPVPHDRPPEAFEAHTTAAIVAYVRSMGA